MANRFSDYAESTKGWSLFDHDDVTNVWIEALREIERDKQKRNPSALVKLLRTDYPLSDTARDYLAETAGAVLTQAEKEAPKTPAYTESAAEQAIIKAIGAAKKLVENGTSVEDALTAISNKTGINKHTLSAAYHGTRRSLRVLMKRKRRAPFKKKKNALVRGLSAESPSADYCLRRAPP